MNKKIKIKKIAAVFFALLIFVFNTSVGAAEKTAKLRECLENEHLYKVLTADILGGSKTIIERNYNDSYVAFTGMIRPSSVASNFKTVKVYGNSNGAEVDTSSDSMKSKASSLRVGDNVTVYGKVSSGKIIAEHIEVNPDYELKLLSYVFYPDKTYTTQYITDLAADGHVSFSIPTYWKTGYSFGRLTNNNVNGYQFFLNALSPQNLDFPENFYIFYFDYETYLDKVKKNPDSFDIKDIEELVIDNILEGLSGDFKIDISTIYINGAKYDYCPTVYKPADGNDYRLEFLFKHDSSGFVVMLYLYYPNDGAVNHIRDVAYVVQSVNN